MAPAPVAIDGLSFLGQEDGALGVGVKQKVGAWAGLLFAGSDHKLMSLPARLLVLLLQLPVDCPHLICQKW